MEPTALNLHAEVIRRCRDGDVGAQYELYRLYHKAMYNTALRITGVVEDAEDVLQDAFVSAFRSLHTYREDAAFGAWLKRIVINRALTYVKKNKREWEAVMQLQEDHQASESEEEVEWSIERIRQALQLLPAGFRTVVSLYLFEGYDHQEIAQILGISESTSKTQYMRAKEKLKGMIHAESKKYG